MKMVFAGAMFLLGTNVMAQTVDGVHVPEKQVLPAAGIVRTISVGEEFFRFYDDVPVTIAMIDTPATDTKQKITLPTKTPLYSVSTSKSLKVCAPVDAGTAITTATLSFGNCAIDDDGDGTIDRVSDGWLGGGKPVLAKVKYTTSTMRIIAPKSFEQVVLYQGATSDTLKLSYREFSNDIARQPFTEELSIPLGKVFPQLIAVKGERFKLITIDGLGLQYEHVKAE